MINEELLESKLDTLPEEAEKQSINLIEAFRQLIKNQPKIQEIKIDGAHEKEQPVEKYKTCKHSHLWPTKENLTERKCLFSVARKEDIKTIQPEKCEKCPNYDSQYIEYPITVNGIDYYTPENPENPCLCKIRPCNEKYEGKTFIGIYLGDLMTGPSVAYQPSNGILDICGTSNPCIFVPELNKIIWGYESWWCEIKPENINEISDITDSDIENQWYVKMLHQMYLETCKNEKEHTTHIDAIDEYGDGITININTTLDDNTLLQEINAACTEYLQTEDGKNTYKYNNNRFNWNDFAIYVPEEICKKHGFTIISTNIADIVVNHDNQLGTP